MPRKDRQFLVPGGPQVSEEETAPRLTLTEIVEAFLGLALLPPDKEPRTQRDARDNQMLIIGFNRAQENLRTILSTHGRTKRERELADVRNEQQQQPMDMGGIKVWVAS